MSESEQRPATNVVELVIDEIYKGRKPEEIRQKLLSSGLDNATADTVLAISARAGMAAIEIKHGKSFKAAVDGMEVPPQLRPLAEKILKGVTERVKDRPDSVAGNPGGVDVESVAFLKANLAILLLVGITLSLLAFIFLVVGYFFWEPAYLLAIGSAGLFLYVLNKLWLVTKRKFKYGNVCPGVIISVEPFKVAVLGNLAHGGGDACNVVKIVGNAISRPLRDIKVGERVPTVAVYSDGGLPGRWEDFHPEPVYSATSDQAVIQRVLNSIPDENWRELDVGLTQVPDKTKSGLYEIKL
jgi:hypothetical protein